MAKIERKTQKIFAGNAPTDELAVFGSMAADNPLYTDNIEDLQSQAYEQGWTAAIIGDVAPFLEEMNGVQYGLSKQIAYGFQEGIAEYDAGTTYYQGSVVKVLDATGKPEFYYSLTDDNVGNPVTDTVNWDEFESQNTLTPVAPLNIVTSTLRGSSNVSIDENDKITFTYPTACSLTRSGANNYFISKLNSTETYNSLDNLFDDGVSYFDIPIEGWANAMQKVINGEETTAQITFSLQGMTSQSTTNYFNFLYGNKTAEEFQPIILQQLRTTTQGYNAIFTQNPEITSTAGKINLISITDNATISQYSSKAARQYSSMVRYQSSDGIYTIGYSENGTTEYANSLSIKQPEQALINNLKQINTLRVFVDFKGNSTSAYLPTKSASSLKINGVTQEWTISDESTEVNNILLQYDKNTLEVNENGQLTVTGGTGGYTPALFQPFISLTKLNDPSLVNSADYSWLNSGYEGAYNALVERYNAGEDTTETIGDVTVSYKYNSQYAMKIITPDEVANAESIFESTGSQPYFILDTANTRFKLPRFKTIPQFTNDSNTVGDYNAPALPNITGTFTPSQPDNGGVAKFGASSKSSVSGALYKANVSSSPSQKETDNSYTSCSLGLNASLSNPIYQDGCNTVQPPTTNFLLYFYLGQSEIEPASITGEVLEELNSKADKEEVSGQWVYLPNQAVILSNVGIGAATLSLNSILPQDNYTYEILCWSYLSSNAYLNIATSPRLDSFVTVTGGSTGRASYILPVDSSRQLAYRLDGTAGDNGTYLVAYRRLGTNV